MKILGHLFWAAVAVAAAFCLGGIAFNHGEHINSIWLVLAADAGANSEPHPCVILSPPEIHDYLGVVTVAPIGQPSTIAERAKPPMSGDFCITPWT